MRFKAPLAVHGSPTIPNLLEDECGAAGMPTEGPGGDLFRRPAGRNCSGAAADESDNRPWNRRVIDMIEGHDYTIYCNGPCGRSRMYALLAVITAFLTPLGQHGVLLLLRQYWGDDWNLAETALFFGGFTALILFGILINVFDSYLWRTRLGSLMFRVAGLPVPPHLSGEYRGTTEVHSATDPAAVSRNLVMRVIQTWEEICLLVEREEEVGGLARVHSDMASLRVGLMREAVTLRFTYTFDESVPRREGVGMMARQYSGAATFEFRREGGAWVVAGHFFDDIGRSGQVSLAQVLPGSSITLSRTSGASGPEPLQAKPSAANVTANVKARLPDDGQ
jgi:hypothetical protein